MASAFREVRLKPLNQCKNCLERPSTPCYCALRFALVFCDSETVCWDFGCCPGRMDIMAMFSPTSLYRALALNLPLFSRPASLLWAFGILAFLVSVASPDDDSF